MSFLLGVTLLAVVTAVSCALPGVFVVLRRNSMIVDAISHAVLPGIVIGYLLTSDLQSPWLMVGAALSGLLVVIGSEYLGRTGVLTGDAPQGLVFPALFSIGVILISTMIGNVRLSVDTVLVGDLNLASLHTTTVAGLSMPTYLLVMLGVLLMNIAFITVTVRQLQVASADEDFARALGIRTGFLNVVFMLMVSFTVTAAFNAAGALLVVGLVVVPAATAHMVASRMWVMMTLTVAIAAGGAVLGFWMAYHLEVATSAGMAVTYALIFAVAHTGVQVRRRLLSRRMSTERDVLPGHSPQQTVASS